MMINWRAFVPCLLAAAALLPTGAYAQQSDVSLTRSILPDQPYTLIYPAVMTATGGGADPLTINHPDAPLQCNVEVSTVEDTAWTPDSALAKLDDKKIAANWTDSFPGFAVATKGTIAYQSGPALIYTGQSTNSPMGVPLTIVHTETVDGGRGYVLDCLFATSVAEKARPIVDFIVANFSTKADAGCCVGAVVATEPVAPVAPAP